MDHLGRYFATRYATRYASMPGQLESLANTLKSQHFSFSHQCNNTCATLALLDQQVVTKPDRPLYVFPSEQATLYLSFLSRLRINTSNPSRLLQELPSFRLSGTWFSPNTREGGRGCRRHSGQGWRLTYAGVPKTGQLCPPRSRYA